MYAVLLALSLVSTSAHAAAPPPFPAAAPQKGSTLGCPSVDVLSRRFSTQSDGNRGGYGYYAAAWSDAGQPSIVEPSEEYLRKLAAGTLAGRATAGTWPLPPSVTASSKPHVRGAEFAAKPDTQNVHPRRHQSRSTTTPDFAIRPSRNFRFHWASTC